MLGAGCGRHERERVFGEMNIAAGNDNQEEQGRRHKGFMSTNFKSTFTSNTMYYGKPGDKIFLGTIFRGNPRLPGKLSKMRRIPRISGLQPPSYAIFSERRRVHSNLVSSRISFDISFFVGSDAKNVKIA